MIGSFASWRAVLFTSGSAFLTLAAPPSRHFILHTEQPFEAQFRRLKRRHKLVEK